MKSLILAVSLLFGTLAHANDGSFIYLDVLGVNPANMVTSGDTGLSLEVYGGNTERFAELFVYAPIHDAYQFDIISNGWNVAIWCPRTYVRPTTGETRNDFMCNIWLNRWSPEMLQEIKDNMDSEEVFSPQGEINNGTYSVLGINPNGYAKGTLFEVYGDNAYVINQSLGGGKIAMASKAYTFAVKCVETYIRPGTNEVRDDYKCTFSLQ